MEGTLGRESGESGMKGTLGRESETGRESDGDGKATEGTLGRETGEKPASYRPPRGITNTCPGKIRSGFGPTTARFAA